MIASKQDVFPLLCSLLASEYRGTREHARSLCDSATADAIIALAERERVSPALHEAVIAAHAWQNADPQRNLLARAWEQNLTRNLQIRSTLLSLAEAAAQAGFELVALKGCGWLLEDATNPAAWRSMLDIDVLVDARRFDEAAAFFIQLGYRRTSANARFHDNFHYAPYWKPDAPCTVEVHRHLGWRHQLLAPELIFSLARRVTPGLLQAPAWCRAFHAMVHWQVQYCGYSRRSVPLKEALEVARFMARPDVDWATFVAHARAVGAVRECEAAMGLAANLLGAPMPPELKSGTVRKNHVRRALARRSSPLSTWFATEMWRAGTLWRCEKVAYRAYLRGVSPARVSTNVWMGRAVRLPILAVRAATIVARGAALWIDQHRAGPSQPVAPAHSGDLNQSRRKRSFYEIYGLVISSDIGLPELIARELTGAPSPADLEILCRPISPALIAAAGDRVLYAQNRDILLSVPHVARYCVSDGNKVLVQQEADVHPSLVRLFLLGSVIGLICHQRGLLALHASAVAVDGEAVAFVGQQGEGKSTLAAHCLAKASARLLADDILVISFDSEGRPWGHPGMPAVKLWRDALRALGREAEGLRADWIRAEKFILPIIDQLAQAPARLNCVYALHADEKAGNGRIEKLSGANAAAVLVANTYRVEYLDFTGDRLTHFAASTRLAERIPVLRLARSRDLTRVASTAAMVLADFASLEPAGAPDPGMHHSETGNFKQLRIAP